MPFGLLSACRQRNTPQALRLPVGLRPVEVTFRQRLPAEAPANLRSLLSPASPNIEGTGFGLSIAKAIADRYGLTLSITNQPTGGVIARVTILEVHHLELWHLIMLIRTASVPLAHEILSERDARGPEDDDAQYMCWPPLIDSVEPVMKPASSAIRNITPRAISSALPSRPTGILATIFSSTLAGTAETMSVSV